MWQKIIKFSIYGLVFLMPLFFLPFSYEAFEFNKGYLLFALVSIGIAAWLAKMIFQDKEIRFRRTPLDFFVLGFLGVMVLSALLSQDKVSSLLGLYGRFWPSLIGILSLGGLYFLITNNVTGTVILSPKGEGSRPARQESRDPSGSALRMTKDSALRMTDLLKTFLWSCFVVVVMTYLALFGVLTKLGGTINLFFGRFFNPTSGSLEGLSVFLAFVSVLVIGLLAFRKTNEIGEDKGKVIGGDKGNKGNRGKSFGLCALLFASLGLLAVINFWAGWVAMLAGLLFFLVFSFRKRIFKEDVNRLSLSIFFVIISLLFLFSNPLQYVFQGSQLFSNLPREIVLPQGMSWSINGQGVRSHLLLGSGLGNFNYLFSRFKPQSFLESNLWQIRFDRAGSHIAEILGTTGLLGFLSYLLMLGMFLMVSWFVVSRKFSQLPLLLAFIALLAGQFCYYQNTVLAFAFWLFLALGAVSWGPRNVETSKCREFSFKDFPEVGLVMTVVFWVVLFSFIFLYFNLAKLYLADVYYRNYLVNPTENLGRLEKSARLADSRTVYHISLARAYLGELLGEVRKPEPDNQRAASLVALAVREGRRAQEISPQQVAAQETLAVVYREISGITQGALEWGIKLFEKALELEPKNPVLLTELGKLQIVNKDLDKAKELFNKDLGKAKELFNKAVELKPIYADAVIQLAIMDESEKNIEQATRRLEDLVKADLYSVEGHFQLGRLYYNADRGDEAILQFQSAIILFPNHSNSLYSLGLVLEKKGEKAEALKAFERVLELNPGNEDIMKKIEEVRE